MVSTILFSIITIVASTNAPLLPTWAFAVSFIESLLKAVYIGLGVGTGVSLFFVPISVRAVVKKEFTGLLGSFKNCLECHRKLIHSLENKEAVEDMLIVGRPIRPEPAAVRQATLASTGLHAKLQVDLPLAIREIGIGRLGGDEFKQLNKLSRFVMLPILGLASVIDILKHFAASKEWTEEHIKDLSEEEREARERSIREWTSNMSLVRQPVDEIIDVMIDGVDHVLYQLRLIDRPKPLKDANSPDLEEGADKSIPGNPGFAEHLDKISTNFYSTKHLTLIEWGRRRGFEFPDDFFDHPDSATLVISDNSKNHTDARRIQNQRQLYLLLHVWHPIRFAMID
jgi:Putative ER transporter, 6TM, N-terminal